MIRYHESDIRDREYAEPGMLVVSRGNGRVGAIDPTDAWSVCIACSSNCAAFEQRCDYCKQCLAAAADMGTDNRIAVLTERVRTLEVDLQRAVSQLEEFYDRERIRPLTEKDVELPKFKCGRYAFTELDRLLANLAHHAQLGVEYLVTHGSESSSFGLCPDGKMRPISEVQRMEVTSEPVIRDDPDY